MTWMIAKREIVTRVRSRAFQVITAILLLGVIGASVAISIFTGMQDEASEVSIGVAGDGIAFSEALSIGTDELEPTVIETTDGEALLEEGEIDVLFTGDELVWDGFVSSSLDLFIRSNVQEVEFGERASELGLGGDELSMLFSEVLIAERLLTGDDDGQGVRIAAAVVSTIATFMVLQVWGSFLMMGVIEEKSSRVVEVLLSQITPLRLLMGKVIGLGILAFSQLLIVVAGLVIGLLLVDGIEIPEGVWSSVPLLIITFILGYGFYASSFAAVGSTVSRQEDAQTAQLPALLPLIIGYGIAVSSIAVPDTLVVTVASFIPFTSPIVLPFRVALLNPPLWQTGLSLLILAASVPLMLRLAAQVYQTTLLNIGARVPLRQAFSNRNTNV